AWDIGVAGVARRLATALPAFVILQTYSRLVIDCNRPLHVKSSIVERSEYTEVPGNVGLTTSQVTRRVDEVFLPYHQRIERELEERARSGRSTIFVALHSFTPRFMGTTRPWHVGVLYNRDTRLARLMLELFRREGDLVVGDNEPYQVSDLSDYGVVQYGERRGLPHVELEIRQDLIADDLGQAVWAERLTRLLQSARETLEMTLDYAPR
ncbi:MAG TPA: N-formylglutamate amidohydrolase, partial [Polyangiaceae bacterium]